MVQRVGKTTANEESAERLEERVERKHPRPLPDGVADGDLPRERPAHHHVIEVAPVIDEEDSGGVLGQPRRGHHHDGPVDGADGSPREAHSQLEICGQREGGDDLVDVALDPLADVGGTLARLGRG